MKQLSNYEKLISQYKLIYVPCRVGDTICDMRDGYVDNYLIYEIDITDKDVDIFCQSNDGTHICISPKDFNEDLFVK